MTANENYLLDRDENATIDADLTISTFVADRSHSDHMCDLGITTSTVKTSRMKMVTYHKTIK